tara:strand:- start:71 stop:325 length:255 start_codon:yes stop_codon:yes gene_type:complete
MKTTLDNEFLDDLLSRAEADESGKLLQLLQILIEDSATAAQMGLTLKELAAVCTAGHFLGENPDYVKALEYLMTRGAAADDTEH